MDIDADGDLDLFVGESTGYINFYRNDGTPQAAVWTLVSNQYAGIDIGDRSTPTFADIDADGDQDLFIGKLDGTVSFYRNTGTEQAPLWSLVTATYNSIDVGFDSAPAFIDIDADHDLDLFIGERDGNINFYQNTGTVWSATWSLVTANYAAIDVGSYSTPNFVDVDGDGDQDLFIGVDAGNVNFYRNTGTPASASWSLASPAAGGLDVGVDSFPALADVDADGDLDLFLGDSGGTLHFYRNDGTALTPAWTFVTDAYAGIDVGTRSAPTFVDIDADGDLDLFTGENGGALVFYRNIGTPQAATWSLASAAYEGIDVGGGSTPTFADIDGDGDQDLFIGEDDGNINFYRNIGSASTPVWTGVTAAYGGVGVGARSTPAFADADADGDLDLFLGQDAGSVTFLRNDGTPQVADWHASTENYGEINRGANSAATFADIDGEGDLDLFVGSADGGIRFYRRVSAPDIIVTDSVLPSDDRQMPFGDVQNDGPGGTTASGALTIRNGGNRPLTIASATLTDGTHFSFGGFPATPFVLAPGATQDVTVTFDPTATGALSDTLAIVSDDPDEGTVHLALSGHGVLPHMVVTDSVAPSGDLAMDLGAVLADGPSGHLATGAVTITNDGTSPLTITGLGLDAGAHFGLTGLPDAPFSLDPGQSQLVTVTFDPTAIGHHTDTLTILSDDPQQGAVPLSLVGRGYYAYN